jgi:hypothetical protein
MQPLYINNFSLKTLDEQRLVGLVMIPGKHLLKMDIEDLDASDEYM